MPAPIVRLPVVCLPVVAVKPLSRSRKINLRGRHARDHPQSPI